MDGDNFYVITKNHLKAFESVGSEMELINNQQIFGTNLETIFYHNDHLFLGAASSMSIYDVSTPSQPRRTDVFSHATSCDPVYPKGNYAYVTLRTGDERNCPGDENALVTVDVTDYNNIFETSEFTMESPYGLTSHEDLLYVGEGANGLKIFDISNPAAPSLVKSDFGIEAYDIILNPNNSGQILIAGPNGLGQYAVDADLDFQLQSTITY